MNKLTINPWLAGLYILQSKQIDTPAVSKIKTHSRPQKLLVAPHSLTESVR